MLKSSLHTSCVRLLEGWGESVPGRDNRINGVARIKVKGLMGLEFVKTQDKFAFGFNFLQAGTVVDNHNHGENHFHITRTSMSRTGAVEGRRTSSDPNVTEIRDVKVKEERKDVKAKEESAWERKKQNVVQGEQQPDHKANGLNSGNTLTRFQIGDVIDEDEIDNLDTIMNSIVTSKVFNPTTKVYVWDKNSSYAKKDDKLISYTLPSCDDFSPINVYEEKFVTFSNPLFDSIDDFTSSDDESLSDEDVQEDNVKIYSNPLFEFDDEFISSDVNPLFDEVLENIESKDSLCSNLDDRLCCHISQPLFDFNEDECFNPSGDVDEIEFLLHRDSFTPKISVVSILEGFTDEPPL
ncbi:hypothetical protein Tco_0870232 [Tanacetum coccineum]